MMARISDPLASPHLYGASLDEAYQRLVAVMISDLFLVEVP
jgi:hypothetical protein